ncbi:formylglycine-generating enzyme family protein [Arthrobacter sp. NPDC090010]|uniref:formylglycine-generating enzyme family protein n=1 Tax=Arthrobacter sp. NPDC090010 TaxID=3363942 RepID=UPI00382FD3F6
MSTHLKKGLLSAAVVTSLMFGSTAALAAPARHSSAPSTEDALTALADSLAWKDGTLATYSEVSTKVRAAIEELDRSARPIPQKPGYRASLQRLEQESDYLAQLAGQPGYANGVLDSVMFLKGSLAEWKFAVEQIRDGLYERSTVRPATPGVSTAPEVGPRTAAGTVFQDLGGGPDMVVIPTGSFTAGATDEEQSAWDVPANRRDFETPRRTVTIKEHLAFGRTEVTVGQFRQFIRETGYQPRGGARWWNPADPSAMVFNPELSWDSPGFPQSENDPVVAVTVADAKAYTAWLSARTGESYRLPTEDEWDFAAHGGATTPFFFGEDLNHADEYANTFDKSSKATNGFGWDNTPVDDGFPYTAPVASFKPNGFGLYDVTGNAREFVADTWLRDLSGASNDGSIHRGPAPFPVLRGGAWNYQPQNLRLAYRSAYFSSETATNMFGFRLVRDL